MLATAMISLWLSVPAAAPMACTQLQRAALANDDAAIVRVAGRKLLGLAPPNPQLEEMSQLQGPCFQRTPLMIAAEAGSLAAVKTLLISGSNPSATVQLPDYGDSEFDAHCFAVAQGHEEVAQVLEAAGAISLFCINDARLFAAIKQRELNAVGVQLRSHPKAKVLRQALVLLLKSNRRALTDAVIGAGKADGVDLSPLYAAAIEAEDDFTVERLQSAGIQLPPAAGVTSSKELARAIFLGQFRMMRPLLLAGSPTDSEAVHTAMLQAMKAHAFATFDALLEAGWRGDEQAPVLLWAMAYFPYIVDRLLGAGVGVEVDDTAGTTPLIFAATEGESAWVSALIKRGASPLTADATCTTAADSAQRPELLALLNVTGPQQRVPGRAARRLNVNCGAAIVKLNFGVDSVVYLDGAELPLLPLVEYHVAPGKHRLKVVTGDLNRTFSMLFAAGMNEATVSVSGWAKVPTTVALSLVQDMVRQHASALKGCVDEEWRSAQPDGRRPVALTLSISADGKPFAISVEPRESFSESCLSDLIKSWVFPRSQQPTEHLRIPVRL